MAITKEATKAVEEENVEVVLPSADEPVGQWRVHHMIRAISVNTPVPQSGSFLGSVVDGEVAQYLNTGWSLDKIVYLGSTKAPDQPIVISENILYLFVKFEYE